MLQQFYEVADDEGHLTSGGNDIELRLLWNIGSARWQLLYGSIRMEQSGPQRPPVMSRQDNFQRQCLTPSAIYQLLLDDKITSTMLVSWSHVHVV